MYSRYPHSNNAISTNIPPFAIVALIDVVACGAVGAGESPVSAPFPRAWDSEVEMDLRMREPRFY